MSGPLPQECLCPSNKGSEPTGTQILAAIEASGQAVKSQIAAIAVDVNLLRADVRVVAERSVEALKVVIRGESLAKTYGIRKKLDWELAQQEDALNALQRQIDNDGALENES
ncbi:hypothetical protein NDU88_004251 [Pleurodeles waltl]|uniref:Uncharacterized protein n=1 Tax=Pleurodeles waltl TaxID=8319 RepID=A0AAV7T8T7_PLEWA|nr:hypothetical protein NDU88_004251 [Pleurodeles waltl]